MNLRETDLEPLVNLCKEAVEQRLFPGAAFAVGDSQNIQMGCVGNTTYRTDDQQTVSENTLYDLASLTKVIATTSVAKALVEAGKLDLDAPLFERPELTARNLLLHNSGLPPYRNFHLEDALPKNIREEIIGSPLEVDPGERVAYSCLGFVLLQHVLERIGAAKLDDLFASLYTVPNGLKNLRFIPLGSELPDKVAIAETTKVETWRQPICPEYCLRNGVLRGAVHDPIAFLQGGVSGNAGLFGDIESVAKFAQKWLQPLSLSNPSLSLSEREVLSEWIRPQAGSRALGWDTLSPGCSAGSRFSPRSFGHTGYTGTSIWIDPENDIFAVLLTNRVHPDDTSSLLEFRPKFHDLTFQMLKGTSLN